VRKVLLCLWPPDVAYLLNFPHFVLVFVKRETFFNSALRVTFSFLSLFFFLSFFLLCMNLPWFDIALYSRLFHYPDFSGGGCRRFRFQRPQATYSRHRCNCSMGFLTASSALFRIEIREWVREMRRKPGIGRCDLNRLFSRIARATIYLIESIFGGRLRYCWLHRGSQFKILLKNLLNNIRSIKLFNKYFNNFNFNFML